MSQLPPGTIAVEYTTGTGAYFPTSSSIATNTSSSSNSATTSASSGVGTAFPSNPVQGQTFFRTDMAHLFIWTGVTWIQV